ncbi:hypothetical protein B0H12DRAFT_1148774, partial [Mycena haematopus]
MAKICPNRDLASQGIIRGPDVHVFWHAVRYSLNGRYCMTGIASGRANVLAIGEVRGDKSA